MISSSKHVHKAHCEFISASIGLELTKTLEINTTFGLVFITKIDVANRHAEWVNEYVVTMPTGDSIVVCAQTPEKALERANWKVGID